MPASSRSLLVTWNSGLSQETGWDVMSVRKYDCHTMECDPAGSGDVAASMGCCWGVLGTSVGLGSTAHPHI